MKKFYKVLIAAFVLMFLIAACAPATADEPAGDETEAVVPEAGDEGSEEVVAEEPEYILIGNLQDETGGMAVLSTPLTYAATMKIWRYQWPFAETRHL
jgi:hypothetical protein